jgi:hypothetical protein
VRPLLISGPAESSFTGASGMHTDPDVMVMTFAVQFAAIGTWALPITKPLVANVLPSEQIAYAAFCKLSDSAAFDACKVRRH